MSDLKLGDIVRVEQSYYDRCIYGTRSDIVCHPSRDLVVIEINNSIPIIYTLTLKNDSGHRIRLPECALNYMSSQKTWMGEPQEIDSTELFRQAFDLLKRAQDLLFSARLKHQLEVERRANT